MERISVSESEEEKKSNINCESVWLIEVILYFIVSVICDVVWKKK